MTSERGSTLSNSSRRRRGAACVCAAGLLTGGFVYGQTNAELLAELRALKERVAELEAKAAAKPAPAPRPAPRPASVPSGPKGGIETYEPAPPPQDANYVRMKRIGELASMVELYGFARLDLIYDTNQAGLEELLGWAESGDLMGSGENDFYLHPKLTRLGADIKGPQIDALGGAKVEGKVEVDFYREYDQSDSRNVMRMRHAYAKISWDDFYILAGQTIDTISPLYPAINPDLLSWGLGNLGDRRPQFIVGYTPSFNDFKFRVMGAVGQSGANSSQQGDDDPNFQGLAGVSAPLLGGTASLDVWAHYADEDGFESNAFGLSAQVPIYKDILTAKGEIWTGTNLDDVRGGIFQGVVMGEELDSSGGFAELNLKVNEWLSLHGGLAIDDPDNGALIAGTGTGSRALNETYYAGAKATFDPLVFGIDWIRTQTEFVGAEDGELDRIQSYIQFNF